MLVPPPPTATRHGEGGRGLRTRERVCRSAARWRWSARKGDRTRADSCAPLRSREKQPWRGPSPPSASAARLAPSSEPRLSSACQLVPWRRDGTVVVLGTRCFRPPSPSPSSHRFAKRVPLGILNGGAWFRPITATATVARVR